MVETLGNDSWRDLGQRLRRRLIRTLDVASILLLDSVVLIFGHLLIWVSDATTSSQNKFFVLAKEISHGTFILLYLAWIVWDLWEFLRQP